MTREFQRDGGTVLVVVTIVAVLLAALSAAFLLLVLTHSRASASAADHELSLWAAESGLSHYLALVNVDPDYFESHPAPHPPLSIGDGSYQLRSARRDVSLDQWEVVIAGHHRDAMYGLDAVIGRNGGSFPEGIVAAGAGEPSLVSVQLRNESTIGSYNPEIGEFDIRVPGTEASVAIDGSLTIDDTSSIHGDVTAAGTLVEGSPEAVRGELVENGPGPEVGDMTSVFVDTLDAARSQNDNDTLAGIFGSAWTPSGNSGDLIVFGLEPSTYRVPSGVYHLRSLRIARDVQVVFDTSGGPTVLCIDPPATDDREVSDSSSDYLPEDETEDDPYRFLLDQASHEDDSDVAAETDEEVDVSDPTYATGMSWGDLVAALGSAIRVDAGSTGHPLQIVLSSRAELQVLDNSVLGQSVTSPESAGHCQIVGLAADATPRIRVTQGSRLYGRLFAPAHQMLLEGSTWYGSGLAKFVLLDSSVFAVDQGASGLSLEDSPAYGVLTSWSDPAFVASGGGETVLPSIVPTNLDELQVYFDELQQLNPDTATATAAQEVSGLLESAQSNLLQLTLDLLAALTDLEGAQNELQGMIDDSLIDSQIGGELIQLIDDIKQQL